MKRILLIFIILLLAANAHAQLSDDIRISGYVQAMPVWIDVDLPEPFGDESFWEYRLQNRLNIEWFISSGWSFNWQMRTRFFAGDLVEDIPFYADAIDTDDGFFNLSWMVAEREKWLLHYIPDRLYTEWHNNDWTVRVGRQRINWGINMITNPNDIFNIYSFYDFDYPERPGTDAVRIQHYTGTFTRWELAMSPARAGRNTVAALMYGFNTNGYDIQILGGYYQNRLAAGGGWAGSIDQTGFKGEAMFFTDLEENDSGKQTNVVLAAGADHMFSSSLFLIVEALYNSAGGRDTFLLLGEPLSADNPSFSRFQFTSQVSYPFNPLLNGSLAAVYYPDEKAVFISPSFTYSVTQDIDFFMVTQLFIGSGDSVFANAGNVVAASMKWNF
jgi:hypothetical protein